MGTTERLCPGCGSAHEAEDNYCRQCGMLLAVERLPVLRESARSRALEVRRPPGLPAPVAKVAAAVAIGTALQVGAGLAGRYLLKQAGRQAVRSLRPGARQVESRAVAPPREEERAQDGIVAAVSEMVVVRRVWIRRG